MGMGAGVGQWLWCRWVEWRRAKGTGENVPRQLSGDAQGRRAPSRTTIPQIERLQMISAERVLRLVAGI